MGEDRRFGSLCGGDVFLGVFGGYISASRDFNDGGSGSTNAFSLGGYVTWIHPEGWYVDMVGKYTQMWNYFSTPTLEGTVSTGYYNIPTVGGSIEVGRRYDFGGGCFFVEPEVQLAGVWEDGMSYNASNGLRVHGDSQAIPWIEENKCCWKIRESERRRLDPARFLFSRSKNPDF